MSVTAVLVWAIFSLLSQNLSWPLFLWPQQGHSATL